MKSSKNSRNQYGNSERQKSGKRTEKTTKYSLDRKSSRGMIYENEELRLRTININAEVERGQSDIKRLRRENEQLRREIWTLRDECDRLNKRFKANHGSCNARCSGGSSGSHKRRSSGAGHGACHSASNSDDSDSCDTCRGDDQCSDDCCTDSGCIQAAAALQKQEQLAAEYAAEEASPAEGEAAPNNGSSGLLNTFDHLSVVSEETLSNSDLQVPLSDGSYLGSSYNSDLNGSQMTIPSFGPLTPLTPIELVANQLNDLQAVVPPLSYFENIVHQNHMGSTIGTTPETAAGAPRISRHTNGWDYNLESPFAHHGAAAIAAAAAAAASNNSSAYQSNSNSASASSSTNTSSTVIQQKPSAALQPPLQTFSTFVPATSVTPPTAANTPDVVVSNPSKLTAFTHSTTSNQPTITFASPPSTSSPASSSRIETVAITTMPQQRAPVFSEKGKLGRNTAFGEGGGPVNSDATAGAPPPALNSPKHFFSPLKPRLKLNTTLANKNLTAGSAVMVMAPTVPPIPVRPPVAPQPQTYHPPDIYVTNALASPYHRQPVPTIRVGPPLVTKPSSSPPPPPTLTTTLPSPSNGHNQANSMNSPSQTDSVNLEAILNDIETISEDILAIQLDKNKSRDNLAAAGQSAEATDSKPLQPQDKTKKPYKSEMNLLLSYEGPNPTITPAQKVEASAAGSATSTIQRRRTRSLEGGDHTDSPSSMPDPMAPFPDNHTYIGFEHLNSAVSGGPETQTTTSLSLPITVPYSSARPPLPPGATPSGNGVGGFVNPKPAIPPKPSPPSRAYPPPLNIRCAGIARTPTAPAGSLERIAPGLSPNKSQLYSSLANAAAKRAIFRSTPTNMTSSLDEEEGAGDRPAIEGDGEATTANATRPEETSPSSDAAQRKAARRVSILCNELGGIVLASPPESQTTATTTATTTDTSNATPSKGDGNQMASAATTTTSGSTTTVLTSANPPLTSGSYNDLTAMNPTLRYLRQMQSYSTPNSPHASRRTMEPSKLAATPGTHNSLPPQTGGGALMTASTLAINQQHQQQRKSSQDSTRGHSGELATAAALVARSRCSRRHSDGTVVGSATQQQQQRNSGGGSHHHGHHHSHQHTHQLASHNPHHSHHSRQDSNHETATSLSDRNSNSLASSRESSTSFSMRSQRRKISVSSHTGGKIPWCGCWGNGCL